MFKIGRNPDIEGIKIRTCLKRTYGRILSLPVDKSGVLAGMVARIGRNERLCAEVVERRACSLRELFLPNWRGSGPGSVCELHAGAGQPLAGIIQNLEMLSEYRAEMPPQNPALFWRAWTGSQRRR